MKWTDVPGKAFDIPHAYVGSAGHPSLITNEQDVQASKQQSPSRSTNLYSITMRLNNVVG